MPRIEFPLTSTATHADRRRRRRLATWPQRRNDQVGSRSHADNRNRRDDPAFVEQLGNPIAEHLGDRGKGVQRRGLECRSSMSRTKVSPLPVFVTYNVSRPCGTRGNAPSPPDTNPPDLDAAFKAMPRASRQEQKWGAYSQPNSQPHRKATECLVFFSKHLATPAGLEPATYRLEGGCSIQLSYGAGSGSATSASTAADG